MESNSSLANRTLKSQGKCLYCSKLFTLVDISAHLDTHLQEISHNLTASSYHIRVGSSEMFLNLLIDEKQTL